MKKINILVLMFVIIIAENGLSQSIYHDVQKIIELSNPKIEEEEVVLQLLENQKDTFISILLEYYPKIKADIDPLLMQKQRLNPNDPNYQGKVDEIMGKIVDRLKELKNPFFRLPSQTASFSGLNIIEIASKQTKRLGSLPVTNFADGLARFMVKRMKEELSVTFFDRFQTELEKQQDLQILFPSTYSILQTAKSEIYNYQKFLPALRESFAYDMEEVLENTYRWTTSEAVGEKFPILNELRKKPQIHNALKAALYVGNELGNGYHPGEVISNLKSEDKIKLDDIFSYFSAYLEVLDILSQSLRSNNSNSYWIDKEEISSFQDEVFFKIYLGLLYQTSVNREAKAPRKFRSDKVFSEILMEHKNDIKSIHNFVLSISTEIIQIDDRFTFIKHNEGRVKTSDYFNLLGNIFNMVQLTINSPIIVDDNKPSLSTEKINYYISQTSFLYANIQSKAYPAAIYNAYAILSKSMEINSNQVEINKGLEQFLKYGTFMATVATSESSEDVAAAIEAVALPPGSARIKREAAWNISLNSYLGGFIGGERLDLPVKNTNTVAGVFAPVGLAFNRNFSMASNGRWNFASTLFASIVDVGALASFRLNDDNDNISTLPEIKLENIISPGLYAIIGLPRMPLSIGGGYQVGPILREVSADNLTLGSKSNRWSIFVAVDIPIVNFWTVSRRRPSVR